MGQEWLQITVGNTTPGVFWQIDDMVAVPAAFIWPTVAFLTAYYISGRALAYNCRCWAMLDSTIWDSVPEQHNSLVSLEVKVVADQISGTPKLWLPR